MRPLLGAFLLATIILLYFPAIVYRENADFFESSFRYIFLLLLPVVIFTATLIWSPSLLLSAKWKERYAVVLGSLAVTGWFIGIFLVFNMGLLDGQQQLQSHSDAYQWAEFGGVILVLALIIAVGWKSPRIHGKALPFLLLFVSTVVLITVVTDKKKYAMKKENPKTMLRASNQKNVFVFLFDTFQSNVFEEIANENPALRMELDGFTFFKNTASVAPTTYLSMPSIHSAALYTQDQSIPDCYEEAIRKNSFLARLSSQGYEASMINSIGPCPKGATCGRLGQATGEYWSPVIQDALELIDISLYRFVPALFKDSIYREGEWWISSMFKGHRIFLNIRFLEDLTERLFPATDRPVARFIHLYITHPPALVNEDCQFIQVQKWKWKSVKAQSTCAVNLFAKFLENLKKKNLYDRSVILLISDHGAGLVTGKNENRMMAKAKALLLIKPFKAKGEMKTSDKLMHVGDIPRTVCRLTGDCVFDEGEYAYDDENTSRSVPFLEYRWMHKYWYTKSVPIDAVWKISGPVEDIFSWKKAISPEDLPRTHLDFSAQDPPAAFGFGWSPPAMIDGRTFRRSRQSAQVFLPLKQHQNAKITMTLSASVRKVMSPGITLFLDEKRIGESPIPVEKWGVVSFEIPAAAIVNPVSRLTFQLSNAAAPAKTNRARNLIVAFDALDVLGQ